MKEPLDFSAFDVSYREQKSRITPRKETNDSLKVICRFRPLNKLELSKPEYIFLHKLL